MDQVTLAMSEVDAKIVEESVSSRYELGHEIGRGSFGEALLATRKEDGVEVVVKRIHTQYLTEKEREGAIKEVKLLAQFHHSNIIRYYECILEDGMINIVMEYAEEGELSTVIQDRAENTKPYSEDQIMFMFVQILLALMHVHGKNVLHRDLKSQNIFLSKGGVLKLGDFGIARVLNNTASMAKTAIGTPYYLSPEICEDLPYDAKSDVWALGCILYELATLKKAFDGSNLPALIMNILRGKYPPVPSRYSARLQDLIAGMLRQSPQDRPSVQDILRKDYVRQHVTRYARYMMERSEAGHDLEEPKLDLDSIEGGTRTPETPPKRITAPRSRTGLPSMPSATSSGTSSPSNAGEQQANVKNRRRWSGRRNSAEQESVLKLPDHPGTSREPGRPPTSGEVARVSSHHRPGTNSGRALSAEESLSQAAIAITAQVSNPSSPQQGTRGHVLPKRSVRHVGSTRRSSLSGSGSTPRSQAPAGPGHQVTIGNVKLKNYEVENQLKVEAERERRRLVKHEKDKRERFEAEKKRLWRQQNKERKAMEDAAKAEEEEQKRAKMEEQEAQLREKVSMKQKERRDSMKRAKQHKEILKSVKPTVDREAMKEAGQQFRDRQLMLAARSESDSVIMLPSIRQDPKKSRLRSNGQGRSPPGRSTSAQCVASPTPSRSPPKATSPASSPAQPKRVKQRSKTEGGEVSARAKTPPTADKAVRARGSPMGLPPRSPQPAKAAKAVQNVKPVRRRLWAKHAGGNGFPEIEIYTPKLPVWNDTVDDLEAATEDDSAVRAEVQDGLCELRDFNDNVKRIWDQRQGRELLQVLGEIQGVLESEGEAAEPVGSSGADSQKSPSPTRDKSLLQRELISSPVTGDVSGQRIEHLKQELETELGEDKLLAVYRHLRHVADSQDSDDCAGQPSLGAILAPEEMYLARKVNKLVLMEDKFYS